MKSGFKDVESVYFNIAIFARPFTCNQRDKPFHTACELKEKFAQVVAK